MGRKKFRTEEEYKILRREYYLQHREEILRKAKEKKLHPTAPKKKIKTESAFQSLINEWNEQLSNKLQENLPQWLKIAIQDQIEINKAMLINQYGEKDNDFLLPT